MGTVYGPMLHHTGSPGATGDYPTLRVVRDGRAGLRNSLSMYGLGRSGTIYCISEKISWHAGGGNWNGVTDGNGHFAGIEAESSGNGRDWTAAQIDAYQKLVASILLETGRDTNWMPMHKEFALPRGRKPDPAGIDIVDFKNKVAGYLRNPASINGKEEDFMPFWSAWPVEEKNQMMEDFKQWVVRQLMPEIADAVLYREFPRRGGLEGNTSLLINTAWSDANDAHLIKEIAMTVSQAQGKPDGVQADASELATSLAKQLGPDLGRQVAVELSKILAAVEKPVI